MRDEGEGAMPDVGKHVEVSKVRGTCVFCEQVIFEPMCAVGAREATLKHIHDCPKHPLRGYKPRKYDDEGTS